MSDRRDIASGALGKVSVSCPILVLHVISDWNENISGRHIRFMKGKRLDETANIWRKDIALRNRCPEILPETTKEKLNS